MSTQLSRISPVPSSWQMRARRTASMGRPSRPPLMVAWYQHHRSPLGPTARVEHEVR